MRLLKDNFGRVHDYLRISLTDKCNLNCLYCNPASKNKEFLSRNLFLTNDEILRLINIFVSEFGFNKIRFTGGEPLVRKDIFDLLDGVNGLKQKYNFKVGLTTNGTLLNGKLIKLKSLGIDKLNISLDTLNKERFIFITGKDNIENVKVSILEARELGFPSLKINVVIIRNVNDREIFDFVKFGIDNQLNIRFIEFMPFGNNSWEKYGLVTFEEMYNIIRNEYILEEIIRDKHSVAKDYRIKDSNATVSFISSISNHFCDNCNRIRLTSDGKMKLCLFSSGKDEINLKTVLSAGNFTNSDIANIIENSLMKKELRHPGIEDLLKLEQNNMLSVGG